MERLQAFMPGEGSSLIEKLHHHICQAHEWQASMQPGTIAPTRNTINTATWMVPVVRTARAVVLLWKQGVEGAWSRPAATLGESERSGLFQAKTTYLYMTH